MVLYELRIKTYEAPDRGDPKGGWREEDPHPIRAKSDAVAAQKAKAYLAKQYGSNHAKMRIKLYCMRKVLL